MPEIDPQRVPKQLRDPLKVALRNGWTGRKRKHGGGYLMSSPLRTEKFYVPMTTNTADALAQKFMAGITRAVAAEDTPEHRKVLDELNDPKDINSTMQCTDCMQEFLTIDGFNGHDCPAGEARVRAELEARKDITPDEGDSPSEGHTEIPVSVTEDPSKSSGSGKMGNKEEDMTEGYVRGPYNRREAVKDGITRAIYEAMRQRRQHRDEALSVYANVIGTMVEEQIGALSDAETKLAAISDLLGLDPRAQTRVEELTEENERLATNLRTLKGLITDL